MRARSDAGIFVAAPVDQIVPALGARPRVIGNFIGRQAGAGADRLREVVEIARRDRRRASISLPALCRPKNGVPGSMVS